MSGGDLGLRRVQWQADTRNVASIRAAQRLGFVLEGVMRWQRVCTENKECVSVSDRRNEEGDDTGIGRVGKVVAEPPREDAGGNRIGPGRHSAMLALCWDDWLSGKRDHVLSLLEK